MQEARSAKRGLGLALVVTIVGLPASGGRAGNRAPERAGANTIRAWTQCLPQSGRFRLTIQNVSRKRIAVLNDKPAYYIRLFDKAGKELTDYLGFAREVHFALADESNWVVLDPRDSLSIEISAFSARGEMRVPPTAVRAEGRCVEGWFAHEAVPNWVSRAKVRAVYFTRTAQIALRKRETARPARRDGSRTPLARQVSATQQSDDHSG